MTNAQSSGLNIHQPISPIHWPLPSPLRVIQVPINPPAPTRLANGVGVVQLPYTPTIGADEINGLKFC